MGAQCPCTRELQLAVGTLVLGCIFGTSDDTRLAYLSNSSCFRSLFFDFGLVEDDMMVDGGAVVGGNIISIQIMRQ
jgi:hypothetical protein